MKERGYTKVFALKGGWDAWEKEHRPKPVAPAVSSAAAPAPVAAPGAATPTPTGAKPADVSVPGAAVQAAPKGETIVVRTDLVIAELDTLGATLKRLELLKHKDAKDITQNLVLLGPEHQYEAESGVTGEGCSSRSTSIGGRSAAVGFR